MNGAPLDYCPPSRRSGSEGFRDCQAELGFNVLDFWRWSASDLVSNATRGVLAEYLVARALGLCADGVREEWAACDLVTGDGLKIEVKFAAYVQTWKQSKVSRITFSTRPTRAWNPITGRYETERKRHADVYVFALLHHAQKRTLNPLDVAQWSFYVVPTCHLDARERSQHSITLKALDALAEKAVAYGDLSGALQTAARVQQQGRVPGAVEPQT